MTRKRLSRERMPLDCSSFLLRNSVRSETTLFCCKLFTSQPGLFIREQIVNMSSWKSIEIARHNLVIPVIMGLFVEGMKRKNEMYRLPNI